MNIAILGGAGYIGSVFVEQLLTKPYLYDEIVVFDRFFFGNKFPLTEPSLRLVKTDTGRLTKEDFEGINVVVDLAGISNDPACDLDPDISHNMNYAGCQIAARAAKAAGVCKYIYMSSCSVYGDAKEDQVNEDSDLNPVSWYACLKESCERMLLDLDEGNKFNVTILRNSTVFGSSPRMRFDLVVNLMTLHAWKNKRIVIMGGGKQWRPLVHVLDVTGVLEEFAFENHNVNGQIFNVGNTHHNYQVEDIARIVKCVMPSTEIIYAPDDNDKRSYRVNCDKLHRLLPGVCTTNVEMGVIEIRMGLENGAIKEDITTNTVGYYKYLLEAERLVKELSIEGRIF